MRADWIKLMIAAARLPLRSDPANSQFEHPSAYGRIWFSTQLLSIGTAPIVGVTSQCYPALEAVIRCFGDSRSFGHKIALGLLWLNDSGHPDRALSFAQQ